jgi:hypothetical protein
MSALAGLIPQGAEAFTHVWNDSWFVRQGFTRRAAENRTEGHEATNHYSHAVGAASGSAT